jgi:hypothetical protein
LKSTSLFLNSLYHKNNVEIIHKIKKIYSLKSKNSQKIIIQSKKPPQILIILFIGKNNDVSIYFRLSIFVTLFSVVKTILNITKNQNKNVI